MQIETDQQLVAEVMHTVDKYEDTDLSLEDYLLSLLALLKDCHHLEQLSTDSFAQLLLSAFSAKPLVFDDKWRTQNHPKTSGETLIEVEQILILQIVDLHEMKISGQLEDEYKSFGINSPRGNRWYNFEPTTYIECGMARVFASRDFYAGPIQTIHMDGTVAHSVRTKPARQPSQLKWISWEDVGFFLLMGQMYE